MNLWHFDGHGCRSVKRCPAAPDPRQIFPHNERHVAANTPFARSARSEPVQGWRTLREDNRGQPRTSAARSYVVRVITRTSLTVRAHQVSQQPLGCASRSAKGGDAPRCQRSRRKQTPRAGVPRTGISGPAPGRIPEVRNDLYLRNVFVAVLTVSGFGPGTAGPVGGVAAGPRARRSGEPRKLGRSRPCRLPGVPSRGPGPPRPLSWTGPREHRQDGKVVMTGTYGECEEWGTFGGDCRMARRQLSARGHL